MNNSDLLIQYNDQLIAELLELNEKNHFANLLISEISNGNNSVASKVLQESKLFDASWIDTLETYFPSIEQIIYESSETKLFEKNKKINLDLGAYENRFIKTLINHLYLFVNKRYDLVKNSYQNFSRNILELNSTFNAEGSEVNCKIHLEVKNENGNETLNSENEKLVKRIEKLVNLINEYKISSFMQEIAKEKEILPPIMKTNIILKDPDYRNCYLLWLFIDRYTSLGYDVNVKEKEIVVSEGYQEQLINLIMIAYVANQANDPNRDVSYDDDDFKERILKRINQEQNYDFATILNPENEQLANPFITEKFLNEVSNVFNKMFEERLESGETPSVSLKKVVSQMLEITNILYKNVFEIPDSKVDFFKRQQNDNQTDEEIVSDYHRKIKIMKDVITVKSADLKKTTNEMLKMEKKLTKHLESIQKAKEKELAKKKVLEEKARLLKTKELEKKKAKENAQKAKELERQKAKKEAEKQKSKERLLKQQEQKRLKEQAKEKELLKKQQEIKLLEEQKKKEEAATRLLELVRKTKEIAKETEEISRKAEIEAGLLKEETEKRKTA